MDHNNYDMENWILEIIEQEKQKHKGARIHYIRRCVWWKIMHSVRYEERKRLAYAILGSQYYAEAEQNSFAASWMGECIQDRHIKDGLFLLDVEIKK